MSEKVPRQLHDSSGHSDADDDYKAASKATVDYDKYMPKLRSEHKALRRLATLLISFLVIVLLGVAAYFYGPNIATWFSTKPKSKTSTSTKVSTVIAAPTVSYISTNQNLSFNYPSGWKVLETSNEITVTSQPLKLMSYS